MAVDVTVDFLRKCKIRRDLTNVFVRLRRPD